MNNAYVIYRALDDYETQERYVVGIVFTEPDAKKIVKKLKKIKPKEYFDYEKVVICNETFDVENYGEVLLKRRYE